MISCHKGFEPLKTDKKAIRLVFSTLKYLVKLFITCIKKEIVSIGKKTD
jgi:hypothetical protein